jgi:hypothetical protein
LRLKEKTMLKKKCFGAVLLAAVAVSPSAFAQDRGANTVVGALVGAAIGGSAAGRDGALVGGVIGAAVGNSVRTNDDYYYGNRGYSSGYYSSGYSSGYAPGYYSSGYYAPAPVYVESRPSYYYRARPDVVYVNPGRGYERHDRGWDRGRGDWDRGHDRGHGGGGWDRHR